MAGMSSQMQRHAEEPTTGPFKKNQEGEKIERKMTGFFQLTGDLVCGTQSDFVQLLEHHRIRQKKYMEAGNRNGWKNTRGIYQIGGIRFSGITPEIATDLQQLQKASPELFTGNYGEIHRKIENLAAEASVAEAGAPEESLKEAEGKQRDLIDSQENLAKKKAKDEEAGKASVREAGNSEAYVTESGKAAEAVADMNLAGGDSVISGEAVEDMNSAGGDSVISEEAENDLVKMAGLRSKMQQDAEEPLQMEAKPKKPNAKKKKTKTRKRREHVEDPIGSHQLGEMSYKGVTRQEAEKMYKEHMLRQDKVATEEDRVRQYMLAGGRSLPDSQEQLANKNEKNNGKKNGKKNRKKAKAHANMKEEENGKAEESVTQAGKPEESVTQSGKAEASVTEAGKREESVTQSGKAEDSETDAETDEEISPVFEDAEEFGALFQSFWDKCWGHRCAYHETTTIPAMCYTHGSDCYVCTMDTLQIVAVKIASVEEGLHWPLHVFGMVSIRDVVDRKRNIIFHRERDNCQTIAEKDPYLTLTGPSRAVVVCHDPSYIEVVLKVKGATESEDKELSRLAAVYRHSSRINGLYPCELSTIKLRFSQVYGSVEATVHVKVTGGSWPDGFKGVFGAFTAKTKCAKVKLLSVGDDGLPVDAADGGMIRLSRRVVSVELRGMLNVFVSACPSGGGDEERCEASFVPQKDGVSPGVELKIGSCRMEATVAWSLFYDMF